MDLTSVKNIFGLLNKTQLYAVYKSIPKTSIQKGLKKKRWTKVYQENGNKNSRSSDMNIMQSRNQTPKTGKDTLMLKATVHHEDTIFVHHYTLNNTATTSWSKDYRRYKETYIETH